ncbi:MAG: hypothetical protein IJ571_00550 [Ruminococcus sp.]|nr:hypothetical protein [Ruminococcus sp.]
MKINNDLSQLEISFMEYDNKLSKELLSSVKDLALSLGDSTHTLSDNYLLIDTDVNHYTQIKKYIKNNLSAYEIEMKRIYNDDSVEGLKYHIYDDLSGSAVYASNNKEVRIGGFGMYTGEYEIGSKVNYLVGESYDDRFEYFKSECRRYINDQNRKESQSINEDKVLFYDKTKEEQEKDNDPIDLTRGGKSL